MDYKLLSSHYSGLYNALGQRIHKAVIQPDGTQQHTLFYYGLQGELLGETWLHANQPSPS